MENNKTKLSEEHLRKLKHRVDYVINESPRYRPLVTSNEEFDEVPVLTNEVGDQEDAEKPVGKQPVEPSNNQPMDTETPVPAFDEPQADAPVEGDPLADPMAAPPPDGDVPVDPLADPMAAPESPENVVDDLQNEIIKHNIEAMKSIHDELAGLNDNLQGLNSKMEELNADVEEVREPTSGEKLMNKTDVSYPYYFNLNDFWQDNWFEQKRNAEKDGGVKELADGTYVADFDDLPQKSKIDVQDSFNDIV